MADSGYQVPALTAGAYKIPLADGSGKVDTAYLKTGTGQGLDADTVDGSHASAFESAGAASAAVAAHVGASDPHTQYALESALGALATLNTVGTSQIDAAAVSFAKIQDEIADTLLGRGNGGGTGVVQQIALGTNLSMTGTTLNAAGGGGTPATTVTSETAYGITPAVGVDTNYARQDHTHGSPTAPTAASVGADATGTAAAAVATHAGLADPHTGYQKESEKSAASGYASLDGTTKVPIAELPTGATASTVCIGNDARLSDSRTPTAHATSHKSGGSDAIKLDELAAPTDVTTLNATTVQHGLLLKLGGGTTNFLRADGTWNAPAGGSGLTQPQVMARYAYRY